MRAIGTVFFVSLQPSPVTAFYGELGLLERNTHRWCNAGLE
jgi:hypothetical protein